MITFAILSPIGIGIGIGITRISSEGPTYFMTVGVLQALAGGTIIYIVVFEVLERERSKEVTGLAELLFVILGFSVLMSVELLGKLMLTSADFQNVNKYAWPSFQLDIIMDMTMIMVWNIIILLRLLELLDEFISHVFIST